MFTLGERAVCHAVDREATLDEVRASLAVYFLVDEEAVPNALIWLSPRGPRKLDPALPIGRQVPRDAEIELRSD